MRRTDGCADVIACSSGRFNKYASEKISSSTIQREFKGNLWTSTHDLEQPILNLLISMLHKWHKLDEVFERQMTQETLFTFFQIELLG